MDRPAAYWKAKAEALALNITDVRVINNATAIVEHAAAISERHNLSFRQVYEAMVSTMKKPPVPAQSQPPSQTRQRAGRGRRRR
jgi:hypothetical protein